MPTISGFAQTLTEKFPSSESISDSKSCISTADYQLVQTPPQFPLNHLMGRPYGICRRYPNNRHTFKKLKVMSFLFIVRAFITSLYLFSFSNISVHKKRMSQSKQTLKC